MTIKDYTECQIKSIRQGQQGEYSLANYIDNKDCIYLLYVTIKRDKPTPSFLTKLSKSNCEELGTEELSEYKALQLLHQMPHWISFNKEFLQSTY